ncbi:hypothetical protein BASA81_010529 [Batrachochytrium salamandrivorans]|nr:hypothetical protein BASA81_010529 [Batrachochytrium salamandrivorans]
MSKRQDQRQRVGCSRTTIGSEPSKTDKRLFFLHGRLCRTSRAGRAKAPCSGVDLSLQFPNHKKVSVVAKFPAKSATSQLRTKLGSSRVGCSPERHDKLVPLLMVKVESNSEIV